MSGKLQSVIYIFLGFILSSCSGNQKTSNILYEGETVKITLDSAYYQDMTAYAPNDSTLFFLDSSIVIAEDVEKPQFISSSKLLNFLHRMAVRDFKRMYRGDGYFVAGLNPWFDRRLIYTRDIAYSSHLGMAYFMPDEIIEHLRTTREYRLRVGFTHSKDHDIPIKGVPNKLDNIHFFDFMDKYGTNEFIRRTDDIVWYLGWYQTWLVKRDDSLLEEMVSTFNTFDSVFYQYFYDNKRELYRGQSSFIDIGDNGYPPEFTYKNTVLIYPLSTNTLYVRAFDMLAEASLHLGRPIEAEKYKLRANRLRESIQTNFWHPDGYWAYFMYPDGRLEPRRENLGTAFVSLFDVVPQNKKCANYKNYPRKDFGALLITPAYENDEFYHNHGMWPFANTYFNLGRFQCENKMSVIKESLGDLGLHAVGGNFREVMDYRTGEFKGSPTYSWSTSAYIAALYNMLLGISLNSDNISVSPCIPDQLNDGIVLKNLRIGDMELNISVSGSGDVVKSREINGKKTDLTNIPITKGVFNLDIVMGKK